MSVKVAVRTRNDRIYHVTRAVAFRLFREGRARYDDDVKRDTMYEIGHGGFSDAWRIKQSQGMGVWQYQP